MSTDATDTSSVTAEPHRDDVERDEPVALIDADELEAARRDPRVHAFLEDADAYLADLARQGRDL